VLSEGLLQAIGEKGLVGTLGAETLAQYGKIQRDPHGHLVSFTFLLTSYVLGKKRAGRMMGV
jgi:hypothetical protein